MFRNYWQILSVPSVALGCVFGYSLSLWSSTWIVAAPRCVECAAPQAATATSNSSSAPPTPSTPTPEQYIHFVADNVYLKQKDSDIAFKIKKVEFEYKGVEIKADSVIKSSLQSTTTKNEDITKCSEALGVIAGALAGSSLGSAKSDTKESKSCKVLIQAEEAAPKCIVLQGIQLEQPQTDMEKSKIDPRQSSWKPVRIESEVKPAEKKEDCKKKEADPIHDYNDFE